MSRAQHAQSSFYRHMVERSRFASPVLVVPRAPDSGRVCGLAEDSSLDGSGARRINPKGKSRTDRRSLAIGGSFVMEVGAVAGVDGMEGLDGKRIHPLEDSLPLIGNPAQLREQASRDGFLFFRGLVSDDLVLALRRTVLEYANLVGWLDPDACRSEGRAEPGKRIGYYQDPDWVNLQVHVQNREE